LQVMVGTSTRVIALRTGRCARAATRNRARRPGTARVILMRGAGGSGAVRHKCPGLLPGNPDAPAGLRGAGTLRRRFAPAARAAGTALAALARQPGVAELQLRERVADLAGVRAQLGLDERKQRAGAVDGQPQLAEVALVLGAWGQAGLAGAQ